MDCLVLKRKKDKSNKLIVLSKTKYITDDDMEVHAKWEILGNWYESIIKDGDWIDKAVMSVINSIVYQERIYFCMERDNIRNLLKHDKNWDASLGMDNNKYKWLVGELIDREFIEAHDNVKRPHIYKVIEPTILNMIKVESEAEQLTQVIEFRDKNPKQSVADGYADGYADVEKKRRREVENKGELNSSNKISFQQLLFRQVVDDLPRFEDLPYLAQLAVENCEDFECDNHTVSVLSKHLQNMCKGKVSPKQKDFIGKIVSTFEFEASKCVNLTQTQGIELKQPQELKNTPLVTNVDAEDAMQSHTLNILKQTFGGDKIKSLKKRIDTAEDVDRPALQAELNYWEQLI